MSEVASTLSMSMSFGSVKLCNAMFIVFPFILARNLRHTSTRLFEGLHSMSSTNVQFVYLYK
jgi:hypothetical protein